MILLNPKKLSPRYPDERSLEVMARTVDFFERKGKRRLKEDTHARVWYDDFLTFVKDERIFATLLTPPELRRRGLALGHVPQRGFQRDPRVLRALLLVRLAGLDARSRPDLDEPERRGEAPRRRAA